VRMGGRDLPPQVATSYSRRPRALGLLALWRLYSWLVNISYISPPLSSQYRVSCVLSPGTTCPWAGVSSNLKMRRFPSNGRSSWMNATSRWRLS